MNDEQVSLDNLHEVTDDADSATNGWQQIEMGELAAYQNGNSFSKSDWTDNGYPIIRIQNLTGEQEEFNYFDEELEDRYRIENGDLLLSWSATIDVFVWDGPEAALNQHIYRVDTTDRVNEVFFRFKLEELLPRLEALSHGSTMKHVRKADLVNLDADIPPLEEQRKIASVLYTVDQAIQKTAEYIEQARTVKQGLVQDLMKGRGSNPPFEDKRIGPRTVSLPEDWKVMQIKEAMKRDIIKEQQDGNHGNDYPRKDEFVDNGVPYLSAEMLSEGSVDFSQAKYLTEERANELRIGFAQDGDVLLAHNATVGPTGLLKTDREFVIIGTSLTYYRCNSGELDNRFLTYYFQSSSFQNQLKDVMRQSTRNQVPITRQRNLSLILPPLNEQKQISGKIDAVTNRIKHEVEHKERLQRLKKGLMQDLLSGVVRTNDADIEALPEVASHG